MSERFPNKSKDSGGWGYAGIGFEFVGLFLACTALGWWLDQKFWPEGDGYVMLGGVFLGFATGLYHLLLRTRQIQTRTESKLKAQRSRRSNQQRMDQLEDGIDDVTDRIDRFVEKERDFIKKPRPDTSQKQNHSRDHSA